MMRSYLLLLIIFLGLTPATAAQNIPDSLISSLNKRWSDYPSELVYLQTSKGVYETGEDLWFKGYQLDVQSLGLSDNGHTLYLRMTGPKDSAVWQEKYLIENGIATGHLYVDEKLPEGDYFLEAYTKSSFYKNDTTGILPARKIRIVKSITRNENPPLPKDSTFRIEFFPEGGSLVNGILSRLAFKTTDGKGNPREAKGVLYQDDKLLGEIKTQHDGMGTVLVSPVLGSVFRIELENGQSYRLPDIQKEGMSMRLSRQDAERLDFIISQSEGLPGQSIYLMGQMRGMICCMAKGVLKDDLKITIPLSNFLYQGIAEFTLFNEAMQPVAERLVYVHPEKKLYITMEPDKKNYAIREKASIHIKVTDETGRPVRANLGISIFDQTYTNPADPVNMLSHCYLSSGIRGRIYNPAYYFNEENKDREDALDLLLLTQGWRRYVWNSGRPAYPGQQFLTDEITGIQTILSKKRKEQNKGTEQFVQLSGPEGNTQFVCADSAGLFTVSPDIMKELRGGYVYLKPMLSQEFKPTLEIVDFFPVIDSLRKQCPDYYPFVEWEPDKKGNIPILPVVSRDSTILLDEVTITGKGRKPFRDKFLGRLDSLAQMDLGPWVCPEGHLENYKDGYTVHHDPRYCPQPNIVPLEKRSKPVEGKAYRIIKPKYMNGGGWFIVEDEQTVIYHGPNYSEEELLHMNNLWRTKGYYAAREFYQPDEIDMQSPLPDARNTLLWAPVVITDEKGEATVTFYCSDINTGFTGFVEGVDGAGLLGSAKCEFRVIRNTNE